MSFELKRWSNWKKYWEKKSLIPVKAHKNSFFCEFSSSSPSPIPFNLPFFYLFYSIHCSPHCAQFRGALIAWCCDGKECVKMKWFLSQTLNRESSYNLCLRFDLIKAELSTTKSEQLPQGPRHPPEPKALCWVFAPMITGTVPPFGKYGYFILWAEWKFNISVVCMCGVLSFSHG